MSARITLGLALLFTGLACQQPPEPAARAPAEKSRYFGSEPDKKQLHVYFFDVGEGGAALIVTPNGNTVLVDSGSSAAGSHLVNRLPELLQRELDLVILTHPDPRHYGALDAVLKRVGARQLMEPQLPGTSPAYDALLNSVAARGVQIISPPAPPPRDSKGARELVRMSVDERVSLTVLWPRAPVDALIQEDPGVKLDDAARGAVDSLVLRITYDDTSVLFAGGARPETEARLLSLKLLAPATLLKVASPGLEGANSQRFLEEVRPQAAVISLGQDQDASAPVRGMLTRVTGVVTDVFRSDVNGEVHAISDGKQFELRTQRPSTHETAGTPHFYPGVDKREPLKRTEVTPPPPATKPPPEVAPEAKPEPPRTAGTPGGTKPWEGKSVSVDKLPTATPDDLPPPRGKGRTATTGYKPFAASRKQPRFHKASCRSVKRIAKENLIEFSTRDEALERHLDPANDCHP